MPRNQRTRSMIAIVTSMVVMWFMVKTCSYRHLQALSVGYLRHLLLRIQPPYVTFKNPRTCGDFSNLDILLIAHVGDSAIRVGGLAVFADESRVPFVPKNDALVGIRISGSIGRDSMRKIDRAAIGKDEIDSRIFGEMERGGKALILIA